MSTTYRVITIALILVVMGGLAFVAVNQNDRINSLKEKLAANQASVNSLREENTALKDRLNKLDTNNKEQAAKIESLKNKASGLSDRLTGEIETLRGKIALGDEDLRVELKGNKAKMENVVDQLELQREEITHFTDENNKLEKKVNQLESSAEKQIGKIDELKGKNSKLKDRIEELKEEVSKSNKKLESKINYVQEKTVKADRFNSLKELVKRQEETFADLSEQVNDLSNIGESATITPLKIGYVNATEAFNVFTNAVKEEREQAQKKEEELVELRERAIQGEITEEEYNKQSDILQAEKLKAQLAIDLAMVEKMINAKGFESISDRLSQLKTQVDPIINELNNVLEDMKNDTASPEEVAQTLSQINDQYQQLDKLLTRLIETKIFQITNMEADREGYDLVFRQENVILYRNSNEIDDLTEDTKEVLRSEIR